MKAIVAVDLNWGIGCNNKLLQAIPEDMKFFKEKTLGKIVVMGRKTFESLPGKKPLKDRINIVLSKKQSFKDERVIICRNLHELIQEMKKYNADDIYVIGGELVYKQLLQYCKECYVTKIQNEYTADTYFTNLDENEMWELIDISDTKKYNDIQFNFVKYINKHLEVY